MELTEKEQKYLDIIHLVMGFLEVKTQLKSIKVETSPRRNVSATALSHVNVVLYFPSVQNEADFRAEITYYMSLAILRGLIK